ncbi:L-histidine N(alpha)-methyltransferase [Streptomyces prunicolor]|uniref:L-histidine N(alpha)-methyltransferase n=1 Tax=Streptomyces prunicolor TaxID=67348 RepID=UPI00036EC596|nr:L-histidine N(alpha)-methyltransferase [Streptomyces prunicolor]
MSPSFQLTRAVAPDSTYAALRRDVLAGLTHSPKTLPPKWFYDAVGSELFTRITELPSYYPTAAERACLAAHSTEIASATGARTLVELGSGSLSTKSRHLLDALPDLHTYIPVDVSESALTLTGQALSTERPQLSVHALIADFTADFTLPVSVGPRLVAFLGSTIGNLLPVERTAFLSGVRDLLDPGDALLLGTDLVKDESVLVAAYDDPTTSLFNKNVLAVVNRELGADFDTDAFDHVALWNPNSEWVEMRLRSRTDQTVKIPELDLTVHFTEGEDLRTEISAKFRRDGVRTELAAAGLDLTHWWTDPQARFALSLSVAR